MYIFDTSSFSQIFKSYYPERFPSLWERFNRLIECKNIVSVKEVFEEIENESNVPNWSREWIKDRKGLFHPPSEDEATFVKQIFQVEHFQQLLQKKQRIKSKPLADPWLVAKAKVEQGILVTEEAHKPNAARIPNVCEHFGVRCMNLEGFMEEENWRF